jgi:hypothetical protein
MTLTLSPATIEILKNFATINQSLLFQPTNKLVTRSVKKHTLAECEVAETFPRKFLIYDLNQFLAVIGQFDRPTLNFDQNDKGVVISDASGGLAVNYYYGDDSLGFAPDPRKKVALPSTEVEFKLTEAQFKAISSMARTLGTPELALESDGTTLTLSTFDSKNSASNTTKLELGEAPAASFSFVWKIENLKLVTGTYNVAVSKQGLSRFKHEVVPVTYHIMVESGATRYDG